MTGTAHLKPHLEFRIAKIEHPHIETLVRQVLGALPAKTWERESSLKYHPEDERGPGGNLLHTLKVAVLLETLLDAAGTPQPLRDITRAAAILHDCCRHGLAASEPCSAKDHPKLVRQFIQKRGIESPWTSPICDLIETHMGRWGIPPYFLRAPEKDLLHIADCIATQTFIHIAI